MSVQFHLLLAGEGGGGGTRKCLGGKGEIRGGKIWEIASPGRANWYFSLSPLPFFSSSNCGKKCCEAEKV